MATSYLLAVSTRRVAAGRVARSDEAEQGVNADGNRQIRGLDVACSEHGAGWLALLQSLATRGLSGVALVISKCHQGCGTRSLRCRPVILEAVPGALRPHRRLL